MKNKIFNWIIGVWFTVPFLYVAVKTIPKNIRLSLFLLVFGFILGVSMKIDNDDNWFKAIFFSRFFWNHSNVAIISLFGLL